uniref:Spermatogenesis and centriole associated 1 n=1 Tax=Monodelphis domestica TaxID=13616 RepID=F7A766_MONDO
MSLLSNYEGLRHQIERLVRENEELKKLVRLIRENHELKSAIKTQAGAMGISGLTSMLGDGTTSSTSRTPDRSKRVEIIEMGVYSSFLIPLTIQTLFLVLIIITVLTLLQIPPCFNILPLLCPSLLSAVKISTDYNKVALGWDTSSNVDPFNASFVNPPTQASTPSAVAPNTVFFGPPDSSAKRSISDKSSALASAPMADVHSPPGLPASSNSQATSTSLPQGAITSPSVMNASIHSDTAHGVQHTHRLTSPTRIAHATQASFSPPTAIRSPRASNSSPSANDAQGPRSSENPQRRSLIEMERKMAQRKSSKFNDCPRDNKQLAGDRLVGEIAFQLDRRILSSIFPERVRLYGFTVSNIPEKIIQASLNSNHKLDEELCQTLTQRYVSVMNRLQSLGYNGRVHPGLTEQLVNAYGILRERPELAASESGSYTMDFLQQVVMETVPHSLLTDALLLLSCLYQLSRDDGKPMFIW